MDGHLLRQEGDIEENGGEKGEEGYKLFLYVQREGMEFERERVWAWDRMIMERKRVNMETQENREE